MSDSVISLLESFRRAEKEQALFYRRLAADAETLDDPALAQRFHDLHADEQHHLSRLTARLIELGRNPSDLSDAVAPAATLTDWETIARARELGEVERYRGLLQTDLDPATRRLVEQIVPVEESHAAELGGKWTMA